MILGFFRNERGGVDGEILPAKHIPPVYYILSLSLFFFSLSYRTLYFVLSISLIFTIPPLFSSDFLRTVLAICVAVLLSLSLITYDV